MPALSAAWIARFTSDLRNVDAALDIALAFCSVTLMPNFDSYETVLSKRHPRDLEKNWTLIAGAEFSQAGGNLVS